MIQRFFNSPVIGARTMAILGLFALLFTGCVESPKGSRKKKKSTEATQSNGGTPDVPSFNNSLNFLQSGNTQTTGAFNLAIDSQDSFYLRGQEVDTFVKNGNTSTPHCLVAEFASSIDNQILVTAGMPGFFFNFTTNTQEYYFQFFPANESQNRNFCQTAGLTAALNAAFPGRTIAYSLPTLCPSCTSSLLTSTPIQIRSFAGFSISSVNTGALTIRLSNNATSGIPVGLQCTSSSECNSKGFDCCSIGQCVNDKQVKSGVDTSGNDFLQAQQDILVNPSNIVNYPNFFHICGVEVVPDPTPTPLPDPNDELQARLVELTELFNCTNTQEGEMALCTITHENATTTSTLVTGPDDLNFNFIYTGTTGLPTHSIDRVIYASEVLFSAGTFAKPGIFFGPGNDNFSDTNSVQFNNYQVPLSASTSTMKIRYKVDGTCEKVSTNVARCEKFYVQGQNLGRVDDHFPASNNFILPFYTDTNKTIKVEVDGNPKLIGTNWQLVIATPSTIQFVGTNLQVFDTQNIKITYFVDTSAFDVLGQKQISLERIQDICECQEPNCSLEEVKDTKGVVVDYKCIYPPPVIPTPPLQQTVFLSSKTVPHRYYDSGGVYHAEVKFDTPVQEGTEFKYENNNLLKPNNVSQFIGFNEIYGSINQLGGSPKPAKEVNVVKGKSYDIFVDTGSFATCFFCGTDYYSNLSKIFPQNFLFKGGGYQPDVSATDKVSTPVFRGDDLLFGRACWVPATMIPWTHDTNSDRQLQRLKRLKSQHFLFANGYQRDWYGFDYGSVIGSFDGVKWFSVGNQRRIKAETSKLFIAINGYFGDLTSESSYTVVVSDASTAPSSGSSVSNDFNSDGAECQKFHTCSVDADCVTRLGWDYVCESITSAKTIWPSFDANGLEVPEVQTLEPLNSLFNATVGGSKRCIYRGRGAPCKQNYEIQDIASSYNNTDKLAFHWCAPNNYCQKFVDGAPVGKFNTKIARFGKSVVVQNASPDVVEDELDTFGLGSRILGRPFSYIGTEKIDAEVQSALSNNNVSSICLPGRNPSNATVRDQHGNNPGIADQGDQVGGIGITPSGQVDNTYYSSCGVFDSLGNYFKLNPLNLNIPLDNQTLRQLAGAQALSTNSLNIFESITGKTLNQDYEINQITSPILQENRCLRTPGSVCFSDQECAPSSMITDLLGGVDPENTSLWSILNKYELYFWKENLVCGQAEPKDSPDFDLTLNRCCRPQGKDVRIGTLVDQSGLAPDPAIPVFDNINVPGLDNTAIAGFGSSALNSPSRNTRMSTIHDLMLSASSTFPALQSAPSDACLTPGCMNTTKLVNQWRNLSTTLERTCCSGHWIRNFDKDDNGGGHRWEAGREQSIPKESFRCVNWLQCTAGANCGSAPGFNCDHTEEPDDPGCLARSIPSNEASRIFDWLNTTELAGIPQVAVKSAEFTELLCQTDPGFQNLPPGGDIIPNIVSATTNPVNTEYLDDATGNRMYSADDMSNFAPGLKKIFSPDQYTCCQPAGTVMPADADAVECCTGFINGNNNKCALKDFSNVSVFFNRLVSSHAKNLALGLIDTQTGFIKSQSVVEQLACTLDVCASGVIARGVSLSNLKVPAHEGSDKNTRRFIDGNNQATNGNGLADLYDAGLRWNDDVYCVPSSIAQDSDELTVIQCN
ncbi:MAG: hypothetical protein HN509_15150 [Halobacteriovoraceae bacterium]|nr:hypothetical protein [Halobacteriovoraceae bacterium]